MNRAAARLGYNGGKPPEERRAPNEMSQMTMKCEGIDPELAGAIKANDAAATRRALERGASANPSGPLRRTPLALAIDARCDDSVIEALLGAGADLTEQDERVNPRKSSPLSRALGARMLGAARALLAAGASPEGRPGEGSRPLHTAAWASEEGVEMLLALGAEPDARDGSGMTPYIICALHAPKEGTLARLLAAGADPLARDADGKTALDRAEEMWSSGRMGGELAFLRRAQERAELERETGPGASGVKGRARV